MRAKDFITEGASMNAYHKHPKDDKLWTFPDEYADCLLYTSDAADE